MIAKIAILLALLAAAAAAGYGFGVGHGYAACAKDTRATVKQANDEASVAQRAVATVKGKLKKLKTNHAEALAKAQAALGLRDDELKAARTALKARVKALQETAHAKPDCRTLAGVPVCADIADGLWPAANATAGH